MKLPCEIRMLIYKCDFELYREENGPSIPVYLRPGWWKQFDLPFLHVSKGVREEYLEILVEGVEFKFVSSDKDSIPHAIPKALWPPKSNGQADDFSFQLMRRVKNLTLEFSLPDETRIDAKECMRIKSALQNGQNVQNPAEAKSEVIERTKKCVQSAFADTKLAIHLQFLTVTILYQNGDKTKRFIHPKVTMALTRHLRQSKIGTVYPADLVSFKVTR